MIIYNVTIQPLWEIHDTWKEWMTKTHLPEMMETGCFVQYQFCRLMEVDECDGPTYTAQYFVQGIDEYNRYINDFSKSMRQKGLDLWGDKMVAFRSLMEVVH